MTEARANEILRAKYPDATIYNGKRYGGASASQMVVVFEKGGKAYCYQSSSYAQVLTKLGFPILYKHDVDGINEEIKRLEDAIALGHTKGLRIGGVHTYTDAEIESMRNEIAAYKQQIATSYIE